MYRVCESEYIKNLNNSVMMDFLYLQRNYCWGLGCLTLFLHTISLALDHQVCELLIQLERRNGSAYLSNVNVVIIVLATSFCFLKLVMCGYY